MENTNWHSVLRLQLAFLACLALLACSDYQRARSAYEAGEYTKALQIFVHLSEAGNSLGQYYLSQM
jgi:hypothetical protein